MKKSTIEIIITVFLVIILFVAVSHMLGARKKLIARKHKMTATPALQPAPHVGIATHGDLAKLEEKAQKLTWGRDPFTYRPSYTPGSSVGLQLNGIVWDAKNPKAMIDDLIVGVGAKIGNYTVLEINPDSVVVTDGTNTIQLRL
jgi:hypothetical protein